MSIEMLALATVLIALAIALFYPETFISDPPKIAGISVVPLNWFFPIVFFITTVSLYFKYTVIRFGLVDVALLSYFIYFMIRNVAVGSETIAVFKYFVYGAGLFYLIRIAFSRESLRAVFLWFLLIATFVIIAYGFLEYSLQRNILLQDAVAKIIPEPPLGIHRIGSTLAHPVSLGASLIQLLPFIVLFRVLAATRNMRLLGGIAIAGVLLTLVLTYSKGSWIVGGFYILAAIVYVTMRMEVRIFEWVLVHIAAIVVAVLFFWKTIKNEMIWRTDNSVGPRLRSWQGVLETFWENPFIGVGFRQGRVSLMQMEFAIQYYRFNSRMIAIDNNYLTLLLEGGVIGFSLWMIFLALVFRLGIKSLMASAQNRLWTAAALAGAAGLSINAFTFEAWMVWPNYLMFMVTAGIITATASTIEYESA
ncbi:MAG: O-antigen ligase family protein [Thermoleophilia bacterium]